MINTMFYLTTFTFSVIICFFCSNWLMIWLCMELKTFALIPILSLKMSPRSMESTMKYFIFQGLGSMMFLLGILWRYYFLGMYSVVGEYSLVDSMLVIIGVCLKMGLFPFHFWFVDVMQGLSLYEGFFVSILSKVVPIYVLMMISSDQNNLLLGGFALGSVVVGSVFSMNQIQLRKMMALSSVAHLGWMGLVFSISPLWLSGLFFLYYMVSVIPLFWLGLIFFVRDLVGSGSVINFNVSKAWMMMIALLSLGGLPPLLGFFFKWFMLYMLLMNKSYLMIGILILLSLISLYIYMLLCYKIYCLCWPLFKKFWLYHMVVSSKMTVKLLWVMSAFVSMIFCCVGLMGPLVSMGV